MNVVNVSPTFVAPLRERCADFRERFVNVEQPEGALSQIQTVNVVNVVNVRGQNNVRARMRMRASQATSRNVHHVHHVHRASLTKD